MTNEHPIIPSSDLMGQWIVESDMPGQDVCEGTAIRAAQWGADEELEACIEWLGDAPVTWKNNKAMHPGSFLRDARRPKPPSLKVQALALVEQHEEGWRPSPEDWDTIRRAIEALPND